MGTKTLVVDSAVFRVLMLCATVVHWLFIRKKNIKKRGISTDAMIDPRLGKGLRLHCLKRRSGFTQPLITARAPQNFHRFQSGHRRHRISGKRAKLHQPFITAHNSFIEMPHDLSACPQCGQRKPAADDFPQRADIGHDAVKFLRAAIGQTEAGNYLVKYKQHVVLIGKGTQPFKETRLRRDDPLQRLDDNSGNIVMFGQKR